MRSSGMCEIPCTEHIWNAQQSNEQLANVTISQLANGEAQQRHVLNSLHGAHFGTRSNPMNN